MKSMFRTVCVLLALAAMLGCSLSAQALVVLKNAHEPLPVRLKTTVDSHKVKYGDPFSAELAEDVRYKSCIIPKGTVLSGQVIKYQSQSFRANFPAWVEMSIEQAALPNGQVVRFDDYDTRIHHPRAHSTKDFLTNGLPLWSTSAATSIPLSLATGLPGGVITAIAAATRTMAGVTLEMAKRPETVARKNPPQLQTTSSRIGYGALRGVGVVGLYRTARKYPEPDMVPGSLIDLRMEEDALERLFSSSSQVAGKNLQP